MQPHDPLLDYGTMDGGNVIEGDMDEFNGLFDSDDVNIAQFL